MNINEFWFWLMIGFIPYRVKRVFLAGGVSRLEIRALFWSLSIRRRPSKRHDWTVQVPLIEKLRDAIWAGIMHFRTDESSPDDEAEQK